METTTSFDAAEEQIKQKQKDVDFDVKEYPIELIVDKFDSGEIFVPEYQRDFVWTIDRESKFIESILLGLPIPYLFVADVYNRADKDTEDKEGDLEIVDGSQRIRTLVRFIHNDLKLSKKLDILTELKELKFKDFSPSRQKRFKRSTIKMIVINDQNDADVRFMMFERINSGSDLLKEMEKRKGLYYTKNKFVKFIYDECAKNETFIKLTKFTEASKKRNEPEELILRFFTYADSYAKYKDANAEFLTKYIEEKELFTDEEKIRLTRNFENMLSFVQRNFPNGFLKEYDNKVIFDEV